MRDPARIDNVLAEVRRVWGKYPDMRLGQLLIAAVNASVGQDRGMTDARLALSMMLMEDDRLLDGVAKLEQKLDRAYSKQEE